MASIKAKQQLPKPATQNKPATSNKTGKPITPVPIAQAPRVHFSMKMKLAFLLGIISFIVYANTLWNGYALDDIMVIHDNVFIKNGISAIPKILLTPYHWGSFTSPNDLYRPLSILTFAIEYQFFGNNPGPSHFLNIFFYAGCVILLFLFLNQLFESRRMATVFMASLLFALHPIHSEVVANIKSRDELLCFFFSFLSLNVFMKYMDTGNVKKLLAGSFCFFLALLSKETVITFLAVIPLVFFYYKNENKKRSVYITISALIVVIIFLAIRFSVLNFYHANEIAAIEIDENSLANHSITYDTRMATAILILGKYLKLLFIPYPLICDYAYNAIPYVSFKNVEVLISLAIYICLVVISIKIWLKRRNDPYVFGIWFYLITISLFSNIFILIGSTMGERFMFFPSVGFCLVIAVLIEKWIGNSTIKDINIFKHPKAWGMIIPLSISYIIITFDRNRDWVDNYTLFSTDIKKNNNNCRLNYYLGSELETNVFFNEKDSLKQKKILADAINYLRAAVTIYPEFASAETNLVLAFYRNAQFDSAEVYGQRLLVLNPNNILGIYNLATIYNIRRKYKEAIGLFRKVISSDSNYKGAELGIASAYYNNAQYDSAELHEQKAIQQDPTNISAKINLEKIFFILKKYPQYIAMCKNDIKLRPDDPRSYANVGLGYLYLSKFDSAAYYSNLAISVDPKLNLSYENIAYAYRGMNNLDSARKYEVIAKKNNPGFKL